jgi:tRNA(fMet)-specific endonuclease VapC
MPPDLFLLDTDICSYLMKHRYSAVQERLRRTPPESVAISAVTQGEVWFGLSWKEIGLKRHMAAQYFFEAMKVLDWPAAAAPIYGRLRANLVKTGVDIGMNDVMIAAHAILLDATLVTNNTNHFNRIGTPLRVENWLE